MVIENVRAYSFVSTQRYRLTAMGNMALLIISHETGVHLQEKLENKFSLKFNLKKEDNILVAPTSKSITPSKHYQL